MITKLVKTTKLHFVGGGSDKVYNVHLYQRDDGSYELKAEYGRRGSSLKVEDKLVSTGAFNAFDALVSSKVKKGYQVTSSDSFPTSTTQSSQFEPLKSQTASKVKFNQPVQLLNPITEDQALKLLDSGFWAMQQKFDGERRQVILRGLSQQKRVEGGNRKGEVVELPHELEVAIGACITVPNPIIPGSEIILDGEVVGDVYYIFDILKYGTDDLTGYQFDARMNFLEQVRLSSDNSHHIVFAETWVDSDEKRQAFTSIKNAKLEGVVFKHRMGKYEASRPNSGGNVLKCKFCESVTVQVSGINDGRSVSIQIADDSKDDYGLIDIGNVTISSNFEMPEIGALVEVRYLYAMGSLYQPVYLGERTDIDRPDDISLLKYKPESQSLAA